MRELRSTLEKRRASLQERVAEVETEMLAALDRITALCKQQQEILKGYFSRQLEVAQLKYNVYKRELLGHLNNVTLMEMRLAHLDSFAQQLMENGRPLTLINNSRHVIGITKRLKSVDMNPKMENKLPKLQMRRVVPFDRIGDMMCSCSYVLFDGAFCIQPMEKSAFCKALLDVTHHVLTQELNMGSDFGFSFLRLLFQTICNLEPIRPELLKMINVLHTRTTLRARGEPDAGRGPTPSTPALQHQPGAAAALSGTSQEEEQEVSRLARWLAASTAGDQQSPPARDLCQRRLHQRQQQQQQHLQPPPSYQPAHFQQRPRYQQPQQLPSFPRLPPSSYQNLQQQFMRDQNLQQQFMRDQNLQQQFMRDQNPQQQFMRDQNLQQQFMRDQNPQQQFMQDQSLQHQFMTSEAVIRERPAQTMSWAGRTATAAPHSWNSTPRPLAQPTPGRQTPALPAQAAQLRASPSSERWQPAREGAAAAQRVATEPEPPEPTITWHSPATPQPSRPTRQLSLDKEFRVPLGRKRMLSDDEDEENDAEAAQGSSRTGRSAEAGGRTRTPPALGDIGRSIGEALAPGAPQTGVSSGEALTPGAPQTGVSSSEALTPGAPQTGVSSGEALAPGALQTGVSSGEALTPGAPQTGVSSGEALTPGAPQTGVSSCEALAPGAPQTGVSSGEALTPGAPQTGVSSGEALAPGAPQTGVSSSEALTPGAPQTGVSSSEALTPGAPQTGVPSGEALAPDAPQTGVSSGEALTLDVPQTGVSSDEPTLATAATDSASPLRISEIFSLSDPVGAMPTVGRSPSSDPLQALNDALDALMGDASPPAERTAPGSPPAERAAPGSPLSRGSRSQSKDSSCSVDEASSLANAGKNSASATMTVPGVLATDEFILRNCAPPDHADRHSSSEDGAEESLDIELCVEEPPEAPPERGRPSPNVSYCVLCWDGGELLLCDYCERAFHRECYVGPADHSDRGPWQCLMCRVMPTPTSPMERRVGDQMSTEDMTLARRLLMELYAAYYSSMYFKSLENLSLRRSESTFSRRWVKHIQTRAETEMGKGFSKETAFYSSMHIICQPLREIIEYGKIARPTWLDQVRDRLVAEGLSTLMGWLRDLETLVDNSTSSENGSPVHKYLEGTREAFKQFMLQHLRVAWLELDAMSDEKWRPADCPDEANKTKSKT
ncbi:tripartite motif-containing protein 66-like [Pollicipes pollicipes]|uniref:tripartite motif-containing protein 66-like n=1 Tax=Pollicipes pollicipes TaxID=41117 RepID=UPI001884CEDE|nr:tripartite motif-containing protein 66-like [Pollicipes pollicipes]